MRYSELFNMPPKVLYDKGVFDADVDADSHLHIDPSLFKNCRIPEFDGAYDDFIGYFTKVFSLVPIAHKNERIFKNLVDRLSFKEVANTCLGYSENGTHGNGIGRTLAKQIASSVSEIYRLGIEDPIVFEMLPFFEEKIGADRISDMTVYILVGRLLNYTRRICEELQIKTYPCIRYNGSIYNVPRYEGRSIVFVPWMVLCDLPMASSWEDIDSVCSYNRLFRSRICELIGGKISEVMRMPKSQIKEYLFSHPDLFKEFVDDWKEKPHFPYDFNKDKRGVMSKKTVFITYCWESEQHNAWVTKLASDLSLYFDVKIDSKLPLGADLNQFMEQSIVKADKVLLVLTREYKRRADGRFNGVGYETNVITDNLVANQRSCKFIPIIKEGDKNMVFPIYLGNKKGLDMTDEGNYSHNISILIDNIRNN